MAEPVRMCKICRTRAPKRQLTRWVIGPDGRPVKDETGQLPGRGFYTDKPECAERISKMKVKP